MPTASRSRRALRMVARVVAALIALVLLLVAGLWIATRHALPDGGVSGAAADELARQVERAVDVEAWARTGAVRFTFAGHQHLWDRQRGLDRVRWGDREVLLDLGKRDGLATRGGHPVGEEERRELVEHAWALFCNDTFWLNPLAKLFDEGTSRTRFDAAPGAGPGAGLLIRYASGGVTPGDAYLWLLDEAGRPRAWRLHVQIIPIAGLEFSWEGWTRLPTGALVSTVHRVLGWKVVAIEDLGAAATLAALEPGPDPFAALIGPPSAATAPPGAR